MTLIAVLFLGSIAAMAFVCYTGMKRPATFEREETFWVFAGIHFLLGFIGYVLAGQPRVEDAPVILYAVASFVVLDFIIAIALGKDDARTRIDN